MKTVKFYPAMTDTDPTTYGASVKNIVEYTLYIYFYLPITRIALEINPDAFHRKRWRHH